LYVSRPDGRLQFENTIDQFFNPHEQIPTSWLTLCFEAGIIAPRTGRWEAIFVCFTKFICIARVNANSLCMHLTDFRQHGDAVEGGGYPYSLAFGLLYTDDRGVAERPSSGTYPEAGREHDY
jgi:hypothetical protein